jgi:hypothetical protein
MFKTSGTHLSIMSSTLQTMSPSPSTSRTHHLPTLGSVALILVFCLFVIPAGAHSPSTMSLAYNETAGELAVTITHQVIDPATHYVREVVVRVDGQTVKTTPYTSQPSPTTFTYSYPLQVQAGNSVKVDASCSQGGSITHTLVVPGSPNSAPVVPQSTASTPVVSGSTMSTPVVTGSAGSAPVAPDLQVPTTKAAAGVLPVLGIVLLLIWRRSG